MTTEQVASRLVSLCREGKFEDAQVELYADHAISIEPAGGPIASVDSLKGVIENGRKFRASIERVHQLNVSNPIIVGPVFAVTFELDAEFKGAGRSVFQEICAFKVDNGKIVSCVYLY